MQHNKDVEHQDVKIYCVKNQFPELNFLGPHKKTHGVPWLDNHYPMCFDPKLGHVTYKICCIPFVCTSCKYILEKLGFQGCNKRNNLAINPFIVPVYNGDVALLFFFLYL